MCAARDDLSVFLPDDVAAVVSREMEHAAKYQRHLRPAAILLAGQPGAGKTVLSSMLTKAFHGDVYFINADEYRRYHPHYRELYAEYGSDSVQMTGPFSGAVTEQLIHKLSDCGIHLIIEGTGRTTRVPLQTAEHLVSKGYQVGLAVIATRPEQSLCSTLLRFYEMNEGGTIPRATAAATHDHVVHVLPDNLDVLYADPLIAEITIWDRGLHKIYDSKEGAAHPSKVLLQYWSRPWSDEEREHMDCMITLLRAKEDASHLGQAASIEELERRVREAVQEPAAFFDMTM